MTENPATPIPTSTVINETGDFAWSGTESTRQGASLQRHSLVLRDGRIRRAFLLAVLKRIIFLRSRVKKKAGFEIVS
jgi:hypothetical protein